MIDTIDSDDSSAPMNRIFGHRTTGELTMAKNTLLNKDSVQTRATKRGQAVLTIRENKGESAKDIVDLIAAEPAFAGNRAQATQFYNWAIDPEQDGGAWAEGDYQRAERAPRAPRGSAKASETTALKARIAELEATIEQQRLAAV